MTSREETLKSKENSFAQRLRDTRNQYRAECVTLTTRLSHESDQLRNEASLLRQAQQSEQNALLVAQNRLRSEALQSEGTVLSEELHLSGEESHTHELQLPSYSRLPRKNSGSLTRSSPS